jgi:hypothetical protein
MSLPSVKVVSALCLALCAPAWADAVLSDGTFAISDWTVSSFTYGPFGGSTSVSQSGSGFPGQCRQMSNTAGDNLSGALHVNVYQPFTYSPAVEGAIDSISFSIDSRYINGISSLGFIVSQNGVTWRAGYFINTPGWAAYFIVPQFADWIPVTAPPNTVPNLTAGGAPIKLGFWSANSSAQGPGTGYTNTGLYDNYSATIIRNPCPPDFNDDGFVDGADLGVLLGVWGSGTNQPADLNGDGAIDGADLGSLLGAWGPCGS